MTEIDNMAIHRSQVTIGKGQLKDTVAPFSNFDLFYQLKVLLLCTAHALFQMDDYACAQICSRCACGLPLLCLSLHAYSKECSLQVK